MRFTTRGRYALRATLALAQMAKEDEMITLNAISDAENISHVFLEQIFFKLKKAGIVNSARGPAGGFAFNRPIDSITVKEIMDASGEEMTMMPCDRNKAECERMSECIGHKLIVMATELVNNYLNGVTLKDLLEKKEFKPVQ